MIHLIRLARPAVLAGLIALGGCASATNGFEDEQTGEQRDTNLVKGFMAGIGAIDPSEKAVEYKPRSPLVVPPKRDLPAPQDADTALSRSNFPKNPEDRQRDLDKISRDDPDASKTWTPDQLAKYKLASRPAGTSGGPGDTSRRLTPDEMAGQFKVNREAIAAREGRNKGLTDLPKDYRTPSPKAPVDPEAAEQKSSSWKPTWWPL
ncbi:hypothetical protein [Prosthecomicrobium hirschii]|uniref:Beta-barrel assembly machine subunit BamF n=1 Tax=Prosthecodimorpha hirschii TaxID=665126 RepID=A0A0N8GET5_9HYPH|nr:hypothetical protein [Prosthecomicrobium hirschii]KPL52417.1 hypothetical protein ABB55_09415 [Prosthecomicrobium hirschii]MCW1843165.1 hypothetical protein [Prosthecomicrobium hirschii]